MGKFELTAAKKIEAAQAWSASAALPANAQLEPDAIQILSALSLHAC
jgi:hypothetical protein